jgi:general secretion pathway protein D
LSGFRRLLLVLFAALGALVCQGALSQPAMAQQATREVSLVAILHLAEDRNQAVFKLVFSPSASSYEPQGDAASPALLLKGAGKSSDLAARPEYRGFVRAIEVDSRDDGVRLRFIANGPAQLTVVTSGRDGLLVTLKRGGAVANKPVETGDADQPTRSPVPPGLTAQPGVDGYELVILKYADVSEVVGLLSDGVTIKPNNVFIRREPGFGSPASGNTTNYAAQPQNQPDERPLGQSIDANIAVDRRLNAIWLRGSPETITRLKGQIAMIDQPVDSVILETQFVELTESGAKAVGFDFTNANGQIAFGKVELGSFLPYPLDPTKVQPSFSLQAAIYAQVQKGEGRIVSRPRISAQSGSTAKIITGDALPILTSITLSGVNGVSQQVQYVNVGVTLQVAPRVSPDGYVTSHIYGVVSSVTGYSQGYPTISQREAETSVTARDGETFVIGGLTQENALSTKTKVPVLGDIPLVGQLFRNRRANTSKTELYIVITPHIVRHRRFGDESPPLPAPDGLQPAEADPAGAPRPGTR